MDSVTFKVSPIETGTGVCAGGVCVCVGGGGGGGG